MSKQATREVFVLAQFTDRSGKVHHKTDVITVAYETDRQRAEVNEMVHRGFITLDVEQAKKHAEKPSKSKRGGASR